MRKGSVILRRHQITCDHCGAEKLAKSGRDIPQGWAFVKILYSPEIAGPELEVRETDRDLCGKCVGALDALVKI